MVRLIKTQDLSNLPDGIINVEAGGRRLEIFSGVYNRASCEKSQPAFTVEGLNSAAVVVVHFMGEKCTDVFSGNEHGIRSSRDSHCG